MTRWHAALAKIGLTTELRRDVAGAGLLAAVVLVGVGRPTTWHNMDGQEHLWLAVTLVIVECAGVAFRRRAPLVGLTITMVAVAAQRMLLPVFMQTGFAVFFVVYAVAAYRARTVAAAAIAGAAVLDAALLSVADVAGQLATQGGFDGGVVGPTILAGLVMGFGIPGLLGAYVRARRAYLGELETRAERLEHEREVKAAQAVADERARIARELHDVAAHHLSGIVVQAGAAEDLVDPDPEGAKTMMRDLRRQGRETLRSMRFLVGVLRAGETDDGAPQPGLSDLERLIDQARTAGTDIRVELSGGTVGELPPLAPEVDLAGYRVIQESLSNARRHAPGATVTIHVGVDHEAVRLEVRNDDAPAGSLPSAGGAGGFGLLGMRERVELLGGSLDAGPLRGGGWRVRAVLPLEGER